MSPLVAWPEWLVLVGVEAPNLYKGISKEHVNIKGYKVEVLVGPHSVRVCNPCEVERERDKRMFVVGIVCATNIVHY